MSRHKKTFAPRANRSEAQTTDNKEEQEKYVPISSQDAKISLAKTEVTQITYAPFQNRAFNKVERGSSIIKFSNNGLHVLALNKALNELGYKAPENEAFFWSKTKIALMSFQSDHGIQKSGIFDSKTLLKMDEALGKLKNKKTKNDNVSLSATLEKPKTTNSKDDDSITYPIVIEKNQKFNGKLIQTDEDLNHFAEFKMNITRHLDWKPKFTDEYVKEKVAKGGTVNYKVSAKENNIEKETEALSPDKKQFIRDATSTADYIQNTRILDLLKQLSDEEMADYKSKVSKETTDLNVIEESLKEYIANRNLRSTEKSNREKLQEQLAVPGLETLYKQYTTYIKFKRSHESTPYEPKDPNKAFFQNALNKQLDELLVSLNTNGFTLESFKKLITDYEFSFRKETVHIAEDSLIKYRHVLFEQKKKLLNDSFIKNLLEKIKTSKAKESYEVASSASTPIIIEKPNSEERAFKNKMEILARSKRAEGNAAIKGLSATTPLVEDNGFDKEGFAQIETQQELRSFLENYINDQEGNITKIITNLQADQGLSIYGYGSLLQKSKEQQGVAKDSIFDLIITDKESEESTKHIIEGLLIGVLAVALGLLSFGTGTVAVLLAAGNFALSAYITYEEIESYRTQLAAYKVDISKDEPSAVWVIISVVGSVLDAAAVAKISSKLVNAGRTFEQTKDITQARKLLAEANLDPATQNKVIKALENDLARIESLETKIQQNTVKQTEIKAEIKESLNRTKKSIFTTNTLVNPELATKLLPLASKYIKSGMLSFEKFLLELQAAKIIKEIKQLSPEELSLLKKTFEDAKILAKDDKLVIKLEKAIADNDLDKVKNLLEETQKLKVRKLSTSEQKIIAVAQNNKLLTNDELINFEKALNSADSKVINEISGIKNTDDFINFVKAYKDNPKVFTQTVKSYEKFLGEYGWYKFWKKMPDFGKSSKTIDLLKSENKLLPIGDATHHDLATVHVFTVDGGLVNTPARFEPSWWGEYNSQIYEDLKIALDKLRKVEERNMNGKTVLSGRMESLDYFESTLKNGKGKEVPFKGMVSATLDEKVAEGFIELSAKNVEKGEKVAIIRKIETVEGVYIDDLSDWGKNLGPIRHSDATPRSTMIQEEVLMNEGYFRQTSNPKYIKTIDDIEYYEIEYLELVKPLK